MSLPPLVEPAETLTVDEVRRYSRHLIIPDVGMAGQKRLKNARVLCVGAGGLGSPALMYLAAAGVGTLGIVEFDTVDESNLQRQIIHGHSDIGRSKAESARDSVREINPYTNVILHELRLDSSSCRCRCARAAPAPGPRPMSGTCQGAPPPARSRRTGCRWQVDQTSAASPR